MNNLFEALGQIFKVTPLTPKDKARELVANMIRFCGSRENAKQCATVAVNDMINMLNGLMHDNQFWSNSDYYLGEEKPTEFLELVKMEIENL